MSATTPSDPSPHPVPLPLAQQHRNILVYAVNWALVYLASPVTYVGIVQASLLDGLGFGPREANIPAGVYLLTTPLAVVVVWLFPRARQLKWLIGTALLSTALLCGLVGLAILYLSREAVLAALVLQALWWGCANGVVATCQWELIGRGVDASRRGLALGLAFGAGPILAVIASVGSQYLIKGQIQGLTLPFVVPQIAPPWNFALLYFASVPVLTLAAFQSSLAFVAVPAVEPARAPFFRSTFGGFGEFFTYRLTLVAALAYILVYSGHMVFTNISLFTREALGEAPEDYAGLQLALRFGFKIVAGFALGWLLVRTNPRTLLLTTASLTVASILWAMYVPGPWFLVSFGILGAGELFGVYYPNYILGCSSPGNMRRNMAFTSLITMPVGLAPIAYGWLAHVYSFQASFVAALGLLAVTMTLVATLLPAQPRPAPTPPHSNEVQP